MLKAPLRWSHSSYKVETMGSVQCIFLLFVAFHSKDCRKFYFKSPFFFIISDFVLVGNKSREIFLSFLVKLYSQCQLQNPHVFFQSISQSHSHNHPNFPPHHNPTSSNNPFNSWNPKIATPAHPNSYKTSPSSSILTVYIQNPSNITYISKVWRQEPWQQRRWQYCWQSQ